MARTAQSPDIPSLGPLDRAAAALGLARGTVIEAFEQLVAEGFLVSCGRTGTWVAPALSMQGEAPPPHREAVASAARSGASSAGAAPPDAALPEAVPPRRLPAPVAIFATVAADFEPLPPIPFAVSVPGGPTLPDAAWRRLGNRLRARRAVAPSGYGDPRGVGPLRKAIADYVRRSRSVRCDAAQVIVTTGTQQGLYLASQVLLGTGDRAWIENPAYRGITAILESTGRRDAMTRSCACRWTRKGSTSTPAAAARPMRARRSSRPRISIRSACR
ncbi:MAG: HTH-type transcriptional regulator TauR [Burkholderia gladioli]|nr:MAG: HTH-type transcriptional regulator TauR [Burkholderia gladioli]